MPRVIIASKDGKFSIKTEGYSGPACAERTKGLAARLGVKLSETATSEMYDDVQTETRSNG